MVIVLYLVIAIGVVALLGGGIWFLKIAFDTSLGWGLACLLLIPGIVFLVKKWEITRVPFLINLAGVLISLIGTMLLAGYTANAEVRDLGRAEWDQPIPMPTRPVVDSGWEEQPIDADVEDDEPLDDESPVETIDDSDYDLIPTATPEIRRDWPEGLMHGEVDRTPTPLPHWMRGWGDSLERSEYLDFLNAVVQVHTTDGQAFKATLVGVYTDSIKVRQRVGSGFVEFYVNDEIIIDVRAKK